MSEAYAKFDLSESPIGKGEVKVKFVIRRAVVGLIALPLVAGAYVFGFLGLGILAGDLSLSLTEIWNNGFLIGSVVAVAFAFTSQLDKFVSKIVGE